MKQILLSLVVVLSLSACWLSSFDRQAIIGAWKGVRLEGQSEWVTAPEGVEFRFYKDKAFKLIGTRNDVVGTYRFMGNTLYLTHDGTELPMVVTRLVADTLVLNLHRMGDPVMLTLFRTKEQLIEL